MKSQPKLSAKPFQLVAGNPALDLVNALDWRFRPSGSEDLLKTYFDVLRFVEQSGLATSREIRSLPTGDLSKEKRVLSKVKKLRECLALTLYEIVDGGAPARDDVKELTTLAKSVRETETLEWYDSRFQWKATHDSRKLLEMPFQRLTSSALDLLTSEEINNLRSCSNAECRWLFLDGSKNKGRRWCDMKLCGNRIKARRYRVKQHVIDSV